MALVDRVKNILITPKTEWPVIAGETTTTMDLLKGYAGPLILISVICGFIGMTMIGIGGFGFHYKVGIVAGLVGAILQLVFGLIGVIVIGFIIDALAPTFGGQKNIMQATKTAAYALTAAWLGGVFQLIPMLSPLGLLTALYSIYLLYLGLPVLMKCPEDKAIGYTAVAIVASIVIMIVFGMVAGMVTAMSGGGPFGGRMGSLDSGSRVTVDQDSTAGKLDQFAKKMEEAGKKMEAAQKSGNQDDAAKAAMSALGTVLGGGKTVEPIGIDQLKPFVPETLAGLPKKSGSAEKTGALGLMVSKAMARYADDAGKSIELDVSDTGGASGFMAMASWAGMQGEKEDQYGSEKTMKVDGRLTHEKTRKDGASEFTVVLGERFIVSAKGNGVDLNTLKSAVGSLDLKKLESMKDVGVQK